MIYNRNQFVMKLKFNTIVWEKAFGSNVSQIFLFQCDVVLQVSLSRRLRVLHDEYFTYQIWHINKLNFLHARELFTLHVTPGEKSKTAQSLVSARIDCEYFARNYKEQHRKLLWTFTQHNLNAAFNRSSKWRLKNLSRLTKRKAENYFPSGFHLASDGGEKIHNEKN